MNQYEQIVKHSLWKSSWRGYLQDIIYVEFQDT